MLAHAPRTVTHAHLLFVPCDHVHKLQRGVRKPTLKAGAQKKLVHPQKQVTRRHQNTIDALYETSYLLLGHVRNGVLLLSALLSFVSITHPVQNSSVLRVEKCNRKRPLRELLQKCPSIHLQAAVQPQIRRQRNQGRRQRMITRKYTTLFSRGLVGCKGRLFLRAVPVLGRQMNQSLTRWSGLASRYRHFPLNDSHAQKAPVLRVRDRTQTGNPIPTDFGKPRQKHTKNHKFCRTRGGNRQEKRSPAGLAAEDVRDFGVKKCLAVKKS